MLLQGLSALLLGCSCVGGTTVVVPQLDEKDHAGLDALRDAQPPSARAACATLAGWKHPVPPCEWPGVTCTEPVNGTMRVHVIDLRYCGLTVLPAAALVWDELEVLELRGNLIAELPTTVNQLSNMQRIFLEMNQVRELPNTLCELKKLTNLYIAFNKLTALPSCIGDLGSTLGDIWLRGNNIPTLPESFCELVHLGSAYIMEAGFEELPACFGRVGSALRYTHLELENNKLKELPDSMASMFAEGRMSALNLGVCSVPLFLIVWQAHNTDYTLCSWKPDDCAANLGRPAGHQYYSYQHRKQQPPPFAHCATSSPHCATFG